MVDPPRAFSDFHFVVSSREKFAPAASVRADLQTETNEVA